MRKLVLPVAAAAALVVANATPAKAQIIINSGYSSPGYYGGYAPTYGGLTVGNGAVLNSVLGGYGGYPAYSGGYSNFGTYPGYSNYGSYAPYYGGGYGTSRYYGGGYSGGRAYGGRRR